MLIPCFASAQDTFTFEAVNGFTFISMDEGGGGVRFEYITAVEAPTIMCVIVDETGQPFQIQRGIENDGEFFFEDVIADQVTDFDRIICQAEE